MIGRRADGYHLIESVFALVDWADTLHLECRSDGLVQRHDLGDPLPAQDLCLQAAHRLKAQSGCTLGADIWIDKRLPSGAGMGGGSSDAATVLLALNRLWGLNWSRERLLSLSCGIGADVPFFIFGRNALVQGIGERLSPLELPELRFAVLKPAAGLATALVFGHPGLRRDSPSAILSGSLDATAVAGLGSGWGRNDLQDVAEACCPQVRQAAAQLEAQFGNSRMTGSGSAVFSRIGTNGMPMATWPQDLPEGWVGRMCRSLPHHPLVDWAG